MNDEVIALGPLQVMPTARLLATAFEIDPAYRYLFPDDRARQAGLGDFFARNLHTHLPHRCTHALVDPQGRPFATVTLRPPHGIHISLWTMLRRGLLPFFAAHGRQAVERLFWLKRTYDALEAQAAGGQPHFYVHMMAVAPHLQGQGHGGELLTNILDAATLESKAPVVLTTHSERNVVFYRRAGFTVTSELRLQPPLGESYTVWSMLRLAGPGRAGPGSDSEISLRTEGRGR